MCRHELTEPGAALFAPPIKGQSKQYHVCVNCWPTIRLMATILEKQA